MFGLVERFVGAKVLELTQDHALGDPVAREALLGFGEEELKHQELFRRVERLIAEDLPSGYEFPWDADEIAAAVLAKSSWAVLGLTLHIELFTQAHYRQSVEPDPDLSPLFKDILLYHWREESQHAIMDELEWRRKDAELQPAERDMAVDELIELVGAVDAIVVGQAGRDADYFLRTISRRLAAQQEATIHAVVLAAYRWQYILSGAEHPHFLKVLCELTTEAQQARILAALAALADTPAQPMQFDRRDGPMNNTTIVSSQPAVNGIPVEDVRALMGHVAADPAAGVTRWRVASKWEGRMRSSAQVDGFEIGGHAVPRPFRMEVDEPLELGGANHFANPQEYLLTALNACMTVGFTALCALHGIELEVLEIVTEGDIDLRGFFGLDASVSPGYEHLDTCLHVRGSASPAEFQKIFELMLATSPNVHNVTRPIALKACLTVS
jgi:uncharacterized OsmC-like protein